MKRITSLLLIMIMLFNMVPAALAADSSSVMTQPLEAVELYNGLAYGEQTVKNDAGNPVNTYVMTVDLSEDSSLTIAAGVPNDVDELTAGLVQTTSGQAVAAQQNGKNVLAAVNADFFHRTDSTQIQPNSITIKNGVQLSEYYTGETTERQHFFGIKKDGTAVLGDYEVYQTVKDELYQAVGGGEWILKDGVVTNERVVDTTRHPRTSVGIKADGSVILMVADGRTNDSDGFTYGELGQYMKDLGAVNAINLDGGGSSSAVVKNNETYAFEVMNYPSDGPEREVGNTLLVIDTDENASLPTLEKDGDGYYLIEEVSDFYQINKASDQKFRLANDIELDGDTIPSIPYLSGEFDGNGKTISGLTADNNTSYALFGTLMQGSSVHDLALEDVNILTTGTAAALALECAGSVKNVTVEGVVSGGDYVGGLAATMRNGGAISLCSVGVEVSGAAYVGGMIGHMRDGCMVDRCYVYANAEATKNCGGLVGYADCKAAEADSAITNCIVKGSVKVTGVEGGGIGGLLKVGVTNCIVEDMEITDTCAGKATSGNVAGLLGAWCNGPRMYSGNVILSGSITTASENCEAHRIGYHSINKSNNYVYEGVTINGSYEDGGAHDNNIGADATAEQLTSKSFYESLGFDFENVFDWDTENSTPVLRGVDQTVDPSNTANSTPDLQKDSDGYYLIETAEDFTEINKGLDAKYRLANDLDLTDTTVESVIAFAGEFDGNGKTLSKLTASSSNGWALFTKLSEGGYLHDLTLKDVDIRGGSHTGALVGDCYGTVEHVVVTGTIKGGQYTGGIVGYLEIGGVVRGCAVGVTVAAAGADSVGGIVGRSYGLIENCYANVEVSGKQRVAAIAGSAISDSYDGTTAAIRNCIAEGSITASGVQAGGIGGLLKMTAENNIVKNMTVNATASTSVNNVVGLLGGWMKEVTWPVSGNVLQSGAIRVNAKAGGANRLSGNATSSDAYTQNYSAIDVTINGATVPGDGYLNASDATTEQLTSKSFYESLGFDFETVFDWDAENKTPVLREVDMSVTIPGAGEEELVYEQSNISLSVGADESKMNFTWHYTDKTVGKLLIAKESQLVNGQMPANAVSYAATSAANNDSKYTNKATAVDLEAGTTYAYQLVNGETTSRIGTFTTDNGGEFHFAFVADPQIGAGVSTAKDTEGWAGTLSKIAADDIFSDISFMLSAGDQVNTASEETEYDGYLDHDALLNLPTATMVGNHDSGSNAYAQHFNLPNESKLGATDAGGDYYFVYNNVLFLVLNTNNSSVAEHLEFVTDAIEKNPDASWKVVAFHHSIYTVARHATESSIIGLRNIIAPLMKELDIDVVLMGHDHVYCRTYMMDGLEVSQDENYTFGNGEDKAPTAVTDPKGVLYVTANSGSGSKYYDIQTNVEFPHSAVQNQGNVPNVSKVSVSDTQFTITTYRTNDMSVVDTFTINKTAQQAEEPAKLIIDQVYGDGGKDETPIANSFVELYNPNNEPVSLAGYTLTYGEKTLTLDESKSIPANGSYLIVGAAANTSAEFQTYELPDADQTCDWTIDNKEYTIELKKGDTILDSVTAGSEATKVSKQKSLQRVDHADTDADNDFRIVVWEKGELTADESSLSQYAPHNSKGEYGKLLTGKTEETVTINTTSDTGLVKHLSSYSTGNTNAEGGVAEIVKFNEENDCMYLVSGQTQTLDIVKVNADGSTTLVKKVDIADLGAANDFSAGDITSVDVNTDRDLVAIAVQNEDFTANGAIVTLDYEGNFVAKYEAGVQPDMVTFSPNGNLILSANEGEPRQGYGEGTTDPMGSVTVVDLTKNVVNTYTFESLDSSRAALINDGVLLKTDTAPSVDLEPEFIAVSSDSKTAYVTLQENNAVAALDLTSGTWKYVKGLGFKDYSAEGNGLDLDVDDKIDIRNENVYGVYMPDGIAVVTISGQDYLITANEGDAREWGEDDNEYANIDSAKLILSDSAEAGKKIEYLDTSKTDGLESGKTYILGGRSFSIWNADTLEQVFDSGDEFEVITAAEFPQYFNSGHNEAGLDKRSHKKGVEPESVSVLETNGKIYAVVGLERMGGIMVYDISDPDEAVYADYLNVRGFSETITDLSQLGDLGPEGICTISAENSPTGNAMILVANEVSGTVTVAQIEKVVIDNGDNDDDDDEDDYGGSSSGTASKPSGGTTEEKEEKTSFVDVVEEAYYAPAVKWAVENGITSGTSATTFSPDQACTRAQIVTFLWRAAGSPVPTSRQMPFGDVSTDAYYYNAVLWAVEAGITSGTSATTFSPDQICTRSQCAVFLWRAQNAPKVKNAEMVFTDVSGSAYYYDAVLWAVEADITSGTSAVTFSPDQVCTRAQIVTFIYRSVTAK